MKRSIWAFLFIIGVMSLFMGCSNETKGNATDESADDVTEEVAKETTQETDGETEEATVSLMIHWGENDFEKFFNQHVKEALPHITLTHIQASDQTEIEENFAKGLVPDLVMGSNFQMYQDVDLAMDQSLLIEGFGVNLDRFDSSIIESLRNASPEGELLALPLYRPDYMMAYNKDIFDAFGVPYPEDHMTWNEVIELGRQLTGEVDGRVYHGLWPDKEQLTQVSSSLVNPETNETDILENKELRLFLERQQTIFNIPGNLPEMDSIEELADYMYNGPGNADLTFDYALVPTRSFTNGHLHREQEAGLNFDWVTYPTWGGDYPEYIPNGLYHNIFVTSQSENQEAAFEVLQYLISDDYQKKMSSIGQITPLLNEEVRNEYGKEMDFPESLAEKNWQAQFAIPGAPIPKQSTYEGPIRKELMINAYRRLLEGEDLNTVIRRMDEEAQNMIAELTGKE